MKFKTSQGANKLRSLIIGQDQLTIAEQLYHRPWFLLQGTLSQIIGRSLRTGGFQLPCTTPLLMIKCQNLKSNSSH